MRSEILLETGALLGLVFMLTVLIEARLIPVLRRHRAGQPILEIGPSWHMSKAGTPTLGCIAFIASVSVGCALACCLRLKRLICLVRKRRSCSRPAGRGCCCPLWMKTAWLCPVRYIS